MNVFKKIPIDYMSLVLEPKKYVKEFVVLSSVFDKEILKGETLRVINSVILDNHTIDIQINCTLIQIIEDCYKYKVTSVEITRDEYSLTDIITNRVLTPAKKHKIINF